MNLRKSLLISAAVLCLCSTAMAQNEDYRLHPGDSLDIKVLRYGELSSSEPDKTPYKIRLDGKLTFPLLGEINVAGMTVAELTALLNTDLQEYLIKPEVYINVVGEGSTRVYLFGEIRRPGMYELKKTHTVIDAISAAGSYTERTAKKKIFLIRKNQQGEPLQINLKNMLDTGDLEKNYELQEGDILFFKGNGKFTLSDLMPYLSAVYMGASVKSDLE